MVKLKLETLVNVAILLVCVLLGVSITIQIVDRFRVPPARAQSVSPAAVRPPGPKPGDVVGKLTGLTYESSPRTLLFVMSSTCTYCTRSMPFYKRLVESRAASNGAPRAVRLVAASIEPPEKLRAYLRDHDVSFDSVVSLRGDEVPIVGTPTIVSVDSGGRIETVWTGLLQQSQETSVLEAVRQEGGSR